MFERIRTFFKEKKVAKIATVSVVAPATTFALSVPAFAEGENALNEYQSVVQSVGNTHSTSNLTDVLTYAVGVAIGLVFLWWAVRKVVGILKRAFMRGKLRL